MVKKLIYRSEFEKNLATAELLTRRDTLTYLINFLQTADQERDYEEFARMGKSVIELPKEMKNESARHITFFIYGYVRTELDRYETFDFPIDKELAVKLKTLLNEQVDPLPEVEMVPPEILEIIKPIIKINYQFKARRISNC